jgi:hypothetical protein
MLRKHVVARLVALHVVDELEPVKVDEQHAERARMAFGLRDRLLQALREHRAVEKTRQRVAARHGREPADRLLLFRHHLFHEVADRDDADDPAVQNHRQMAVMPRGHEPHAFLQRPFRIDGQDVGRHDVAYERVA